MQVSRRGAWPLAGAIGILVVLNLFVFYTALAPRALTVTVLDVGQGDAILVEGPTGVTLLIDGGPDRGVLREVGEVLPFWKRSIDAVVATHPDADHIGGLPDILERYEVSYFIEPGIPRDTGAAKELAARVEKEPEIKRVVARRGMRLDLGGGAYADILYPDRDPSKMEVNYGSVVMRLSYGATSFMLMGDLPSKIEEWLLVLDGKSSKLPVTVLKVGHHGSKYSTSEEWLEALSPQVAAVSVGAQNSYGHPTSEVLERLTETHIKIERTDLSGRLKFVSNGETVARR